MKFEDIEKLWSEDCYIDKSELAVESLKIPSLHHKYYKIYVSEKIMYKKMENDHKELMKRKYDYLTGKFSDDDYAATGWPVQNKIILKSDIPIHMDADKDLCNSLLKLAAQKEKADFLESIIKTLKDRNFTIKNAVDFLRWTSGG